MKTSKILIAICASASIMGISFAESNGTQDADRAACKAEREMRKATIDTDGDGKISKEERTAHAELVFDEIGNGTDSVTVADIKAHRQAKIENSACKGMRKKRQDTDIVTREEFVKKASKKHARRRNHG